MSDSAADLWRRLGSGDAESLKVFLLRHEDYAAGFTGRILRDGELRIPGPVSGGVFGVYGEDGLRGAVLWSHSGIAFPVFEQPLSLDQGARLCRFFQGGSVASILGAAPHVDAFEEALGVVPRVSVAYRSLYRPLDLKAMEAAAAPTPGARARCVEPDEINTIFPLHSAYEREEVVTAIHHFDPAASRASLKRILESETVAAVELDGRLVATARTNARGVRTWQIGGVYVVPELRGRGFGRYVVRYLLEALDRADKAASLFVKEKNAPARGLYLSMGFQDVGPYRVDYL